MKTPENKRGPQETARGRSHLTACSTRLSRGLRLGSLVDERMPVPQLLASVLLNHKSTKSVPADEATTPPPLPQDTDLSKKAASRRLSSTLWRVPALTWQFMSWAREMKTDVPLTSSSFSAGSPSSYSFGWQRFPIWLMSSAGSDARSCRERPPLPPRPPPESWPRSGRASTRSPTTEEGRPVHNEDLTRHE